MSVRFTLREPAEDDQQNPFYDVSTNDGRYLGTVERVRRGLWRVRSWDGSFGTYATNREAAGWALLHEYNDAHPAREPLDDSEVSS